MPQFLPFAGIRYNLDALDAGLDRLTAPPYDVIDEELRGRLEAAHPHNAVQLILPRDGSGADRYQRAATTFAAWQAQGILVRDPARFYLSRMRFADEDGGSRTTTGVIGALELSPPGAGAVLPHERTMPKPKGDRLELLRTVRANLDPVWGLSLAPGLSALLEPEGPPLATAVDEDGVVHEVFAVDDPSHQSAIAAAVASASLVIADGHHRYETALAYRSECAAAGAPPGEPDRIMALVVELADEQLCVRPIHRLLSGLAGTDVRTTLAASFTVTDHGANTPPAVDGLRAAMRDTGGIGLVDGGGLALLVPRAEVLAPALAALPEPVRAVDASIVDVGVLPALRGVDVSYRHDGRAVAELVAKGAADAAVLLKPVTVAQITAVAAAGERMPEKTSFFHPKPRTGLVFRSLDT